MLARRPIDRTKTEIVPLRTKVVAHPQTAQWAALPGSHAALAGFHRSCPQNPGSPPCPACRHRPVTGRVWLLPGQ